MKICHEAMMKQYETLFHRHDGNPILTGNDWPYSINSVFNAGATLLRMGRLFCYAAWKIAGGLSHLVRCPFGKRSRSVGKSIVNRHFCQIQTNSPKKCGVLKIRASPTCRN